MSLGIGHLQAVVHVAEQGSFTRAADALHITQPALSHRIAEAERLLRVRLFDRTRRTISMTRAGENVVEAARRTLGAHERGMNKVYAAAGESRSAVHVAALPSLAAVVLPSAIRDLASLMPGTHCTVTAADAEKVISLVREGTCDFGLTALDVPHPAVWSAQIHEDRFVALLPPTHHLALETHVAWGDLVRERFIIPPLSSSLHHILLETFNSTRQAPTDTMAGADLASTAGLVAAGLGVAVIPRLTLPLTSFADLAIREIAGPTISRSIFCMGSYDSVLDPASQSLLASVEAILS